MGHEPIQLSVSQANHSGLSWLADLRKLQVVSEPKFLNLLLLHTRTSTSGQGDIITTSAVVQIKTTKRSK